MSLLSLGFGFAAATMDPFMVTIAQSLAGLPLYSGLWLRAIFFATMFTLVFLFVRRHARTVERDPVRSLVYDEDQRLRSSMDVAGAVASEAEASRPRMRAAVRWLGLWFLGAVVFILAATRIKAISPYAFPLMGLFFAVACNGAALVAGEKPRPYRGELPEVAALDTAAASHHRARLSRVHGIRRGHQVRPVLGPAQEKKFLFPPHASW
jgi:uncharacterized ion transporter superfamily protein YfcC